MQRRIVTCFRDADVDIIAVSKHFVSSNQDWV